MSLFDYIYRDIIGTAIYHACMQCIALCVCLRVCVCVRVCRCVV